MLAFSIATGLALATSPLRGAPQLHRGSALSMYNGGGNRDDRYGGGGGYRDDRDTYDRFDRPTPTLGAERIESIKACFITGTVGTAVASPLLVNILSKGGSAPLQLGLLFIATSLFGAVYRCAVRTDGNAQLKVGAIAAFALLRALAAVPASASTWGPVVQADFLGQLWIGAAAFGHAAIAYESAVDNGYAFRLEGYSRALDLDFPDDRGYGDGYNGRRMNSRGDGSRGYGDDGYGYDNYDNYGNNSNSGNYRDNDRSSYGTQGDFYGNNRGGSLNSNRDSYGNGRDMVESGLSRYGYEEDMRNNRPPL